MLDMQGLGYAEKQIFIYVAYTKYYSFGILIILDVEFNNEKFIF